MAGIMAGGITTVTLGPLPGVGMGIIGYGVGKKSSKKWCKKCSKDPFIKIK